MSVLLRPEDGISEKYYFENPSVFKLIKFIYSQNVAEINNFGKFIVRANKIRSAQLS